MDAAQAQHVRYCSRFASLLAIQRLWQAVLKQFGCTTTTFEAQARGSEVPTSSFDAPAGRCEAPAGRFEAPADCFETPAGGFEALASCFDASAGSFEAPAGKIETKVSKTLRMAAKSRPRGCPRGGRGGACTYHWGYGKMQYLTSRELRNTAYASKITILSKPGKTHPSGRYD